MSRPIATVAAAGPGRAWVCPLCGHSHAPARLAAGERATCVRCGALIAKRGLLGAHAPLAFVVAGLLLAAPAMALPFVSVAKFGGVRLSFMDTGAAALWDGGMPLLAIWVLLCGALAPLLLLAGLVALLMGGRRRFPPPARHLLLRAIHALERWAMPEVHVLAVLVALIKLGTLVDVAIGPGFWCYAGMSVVLLLAWRSFEYEATEPAAPAREGAAAS